MRIFEYVSSTKTFIFLQGIFFTIVTNFVILRPDCNFKQERKHEKDQSSRCRLWKHR